MAASLGGNHLQFKEQVSLAETDSHFRGTLDRACLLSEKHYTKRDIADLALRGTLNDGPVHQQMIFKGSVVWFFCLHN